MGENLYEKIQEIVTCVSLKIMEADDAVDQLHALAAAPRVRIVDDENHGHRIAPFALVNRFGRVVSTYWLPDEYSTEFMDKCQPMAAPHRVVRVALVDFNYPATPESSERVSNAYQLSSAEQEALDALRRNPTVSVHGYSGTLLLNIIDALTAALEVPRD